MGRGMRAGKKPSMGGGMGGGSMQKQMQQIQQMQRRMEQMQAELEEKEISIAFYLYGAVAVILLQWIWKLCLIFTNAL